MKEDSEELQNEEFNNPAQEVEVELVKSGSSVKERKAALDEEAVVEDDEGQLTIDVYQNPEEIIIESPIAGVKPDDLDVSITNESVTIRGTREKERRIKEEDYFYQECYWGRFSRSIILPQEVDAEKSEAFIKNGVLIVKMPKLNRQRSKRLQIKPLS